MRTAYEDGRLYSLDHCLMDLPYVPFFICSSSIWSRDLDFDILAERFVLYSPTMLLVLGVDILFEIPLRCDRKCGGGNH